MKEFLSIFANDIIKNRMEKDLDSVFIIFGPEGAGKSVSALILSKYLSENIPKLEFNIKENIIYHAPEFIKKFNQGHQILIIDEALHLMNSKEHMGNSILAKELFTGRFRQNVLFVIAQNLRWLDPIIREHRARGFILTYRDLKEDKVTWYYFSASNSRNLLFLSKNMIYSKEYIRTIEKKIMPDKIVDIDMSYVNDLLEEYKQIKRINNLLISLLLIHGISEYKFQRMMAKRSDIQKNLSFWTDFFALLKTPIINYLSKYNDRYAESLRNIISSKNIKEILGDELTPEEQNILYEKYQAYLKEIVPRYLRYYKEEQEKIFRKMHKR